MGRRRLPDPRTLVVAVRVCRAHDPALYRAIAALPPVRRSARLRDALKIGLLGETPATGVSLQVPRAAAEATRTPSSGSDTVQARCIPAADAIEPSSRAPTPQPTSDEERAARGDFGQQWLSAFDPGVL